MEQGSLKGFVDQAAADLIGGWLADVQGGKAPLVQLEIDGKVIARQRCNLDRADLGAAGMPTTEHGFEFDLPYPVPHGARVEVRATSTGTLLEWSVPRPVTPPVPRSADKDGAPLTPGTPQQREAMLTLALHGTQAAAAMAQWPQPGGPGASADTLLHGLLMHVARGEADSPG